MNNVAKITEHDLVNRYVLWLSSLSNDVKLGIIEGLSASMRSTHSKSDNSMDFLEKLSDAWSDNASVDHIMHEIRGEERSSLQRTIETW